MVNTKEVIESGVLETYLLGLAPVVEQKRIKEMIEADGQLANYLAETEDKIQTYFAKNAVLPPPVVRNILLLRSPDTDITKPKHVFKRTKQNENPPAKKYLDIEVNDTHIKVHKYWRPAFITVFVLSKIFLIAGLYFYFKSASLQDEVARLKTEIRH